MLGSAISGRHEKSSDAQNFFIAHLKRLQLKRDFSYRCMTMAAWPIKELKALAAENLKSSDILAGDSLTANGNTSMLVVPHAGVLPDDSTK